MSTVTLLTTDQAFEDVCKLVDGTRKRVVKIDREVLDLILIDYGVMVRELGARVKTKPQHRERARLTRS